MTDVLDRKTIKALSADSRQSIMKMLAKRPCTAIQIAKATGKHVTTMTEHLDTLESSDLIRKKESTNKWVYYELTKKGEHLFKPQSYSWVVVFSLSAVLVFTGFLRLLEPQTASGTFQEAASVMSGAAQKSAAYVTSADYTGYILIGLGIAGFIYIVYRRYISKA